MPAILVVDDAPFFRRYLADLLEERGYRVVQAASGDEVPEIVTCQEIAAVLTDIEMPGISGAEVLRRVKRLRPDIPVIIISSHEDFAVAREVLRGGALDYLVKPLQRDELLAAVDRAMRARQEFLKSAAVQREAQRRLSDLVLLREVGETASSGEDLQRLFDKILDSIKVSADVGIASLMLLEDDGLMHIRAARGLSADIVESVRVAPGEGISGHVLASGEAVLIDDLSRDGRFPSSGGGDRYQTRSLLSVPIRCRDQVIGVLNVNNKRSGETFTADDQNLLAAIAHQAALAIENFKLVSSLRQQARELEEAHGDLVKQYQARSRLVCNLSHELKTPLTSVLGYVDLILNFSRQIGDEERRDYLEKVYAESLNLERLITGMLRLFSIDSGREEWDQRDFSLAELVTEALEKQKPALSEKGVRVEVDLAGDLADLYSDREKAAILIHSLMDNAVKFNRPGGMLEIRAENRAVDGLGHVYLRIHNDGRSVPEEAGEDIFDPYTQLGDINTDKPQGVGIGLALCRAIVARMQGRIFLEPAGIEGTTFGLLLPTRETYGVLTDEKE